MAFNAALLIEAARGNGRVTYFPFRINGHFYSYPLFISHFPNSFAFSPLFLAARWRQVHICTSLLHADVSLNKHSSIPVCPPALWSVSRSLIGMCESSFLLFEYFFELIIEYLGTRLIPDVIINTWFLIQICVQQPFDVSWNNTKMLQNSSSNEVAICKIHI